MLKITHDLNQQDLKIINRHFTFIFILKSFDMRIAIMSSACGISSVQSVPDVSPSLLLFVNGDIP